MKWIRRLVSRLRILRRLRVIEAFLAKVHPCPGCGTFMDLDAVVDKRASLMEDADGRQYVVCCWCRSRADGTPVKHLRRLGPGRRAAACQ